MHSCVLYLPSFELWIAIFFCVNLNKESSCAFAQHRQTRVSPPNLNPPTPTWPPPTHTTPNTPPPPPRLPQAVFYGASKITRFMRHIFSLACEGQITLIKLYSRSRAFLCRYLPTTSASLARPRLLAADVEEFYSINAWIKISQSYLKGEKMRGG